VLEGAYVARQHCGSGVVGGHPPAKIAICAGTRLLASVAPASTNAFYPPVQIVFGLVKGRRRSSGLARGCSRPRQPRSEVLQSGESNGGARRSAPTQAAATLLESMQGGGVQLATCGFERRAL
jgi:hypothetical protein